jgi:hypothetical protein
MIYVVHAAVTVFKASNDQIMGKISNDQMMGKISNDQMMDALRQTPVRGVEFSGTQLSILASIIVTAA